MATRVVGRDSERSGGCSVVSKFGLDQGSWEEAVVTRPSVRLPGKCVVGYQSTGRRRLHQGLHSTQLISIRFGVNNLLSHTWRLPTQHLHLNTPIAAIKTPTIATTSPATATKPFPFLFRSSRCWVEIGVPDVGVLCTRQASRQNAIPSMMRQSISYTHGFHTRGILLRWFEAYL